MRPEKVQDKKGKANVRKGSKGAKNSVLSSEPHEILPFVNRIICADALRALARIPDQSIDLIITSPPYNFGHAYEQDPHDDTHEWNEYFKIYSCGDTILLTDSLRCQITIKNNIYPY